MKCYFGHPLLFVRISHVFILGKSEASTKRNSEPRKKKEKIENRKEKINMLESLKPGLPRLNPAPAEEANEFFLPKLI